MDSRRIVWQETRVIALGVAVGVGLMLGVFALLGSYDMSVLLGGIVGGALAVGNFFSMAVIASLAADRAARQDAPGGARLIQSAWPLRLLTLGGVLFACAYSGRFQVVALVLPMLFVRPVVTLAAFFRKKEA